MPKTDFHMHTTFVDGQNSVEEMAEALELYFTDPAAVKAMQKLKEGNGNA